MDVSRRNLFEGEHYEAIGRLVIACTQLEAIVTDIVSEFGGMERDLALVLVHRRSLQEKVKSIREIAKSRDRDLERRCALDQVLDLLEQSRDEYDYRSQIVHHAWTRGDGGTPFTERVTALGDRGMNPIHRPTREILERADRVHDICERPLAFLPAGDVEG